MRYFIILLLIVSVATFGKAVLAQDNLGAQKKVAEYPLANTANLGIFTPDSPFYFLQQFIEWAQLQLIPSPIERAKHELALMERRIAEISDLAKRGQLTIERAQVLQSEAIRLFNDAKDRIQRAAVGGTQIKELTSKMEAMLIKQEEVLRESLQKAIAYTPETARTFFERALEIIHNIKEWIMQVINLIPLPNFPATPEPAE